MHWMLRLAGFDFEIKHELVKASQQAYVLSSLGTDAERVKHDDDDDIPVFLVIVTTYKTNTYIVEHSLINLDFHIMDAVYATQEAPNLHDAEFTPIKLEEFVSTQMHDLFSTELRRRLNVRRYWHSKRR